MSTSYTWDVFSSIDGFGSHHGGDWGGGYWGKQGPPQLLARRLEIAEQPQRMIFGATTYRTHVQMLAADSDPEAYDPWVTRMWNLPMTVISSTLHDLDRANATVVSGDGVEIVGGLKRESPVPLRSHGSLSLNRTLLAAGLIDFLHLTIFPVLTGRTGDGRILDLAEDFDLELVEQRTLDGRTQELIYRRAPRSAMIARCST